MSGSTGQHRDYASTGFDCSGPAPFFACTHVGIGPPHHFNVSTRIPRSVVPAAEPADLIFYSPRQPTTSSNSRVINARESGPSSDQSLGLNRYAGAVRLLW